MKLAAVLAAAKHAPAVRHEQAVFLRFQEAIDVCMVDGLETLRNQQVKRFSERLIRACSRRWFPRRG